MTPTGKVMVTDDSPARVKGLFLDWDYEVTGTEDIFGKLSPRKNWCYRVRNWGPNTSGVTNYCKINGPGNLWSTGLLGDADQDYVGIVGCGAGSPWNEHYPASHGTYLDHATLTFTGGSLDYYEYMWRINQFGVAGTAIGADVRIQVGDYPWIFDMYEALDFDVETGEPANFEVRSGAHVIFNFFEHMRPYLGANGGPVCCQRHIGFPFTIGDLLTQQCGMAQEPEPSYVGDGNDGVLDNDPEDEFFGYRDWCHDNDCIIDLW